MLDILQILLAISIIPTAAFVFLAAYTFFSHKRRGHTRFKAK
ncbi:hypothetical protein [Vitreoscilla massiliensis]|nr:hypothetical protein [Vitreoscilla massiliensis]